jgi:hypothetical protein
MSNNLSGAYTGRIIIITTATTTIATYHVFGLKIMPHTSPFIKYSMLHRNVSSSRLLLLLLLLAASTASRSKS